MIDKFIISTTINSPTEAIKRFDNMHHWKLVVVGDKKTPKNFKLKNGVFLSPPFPDAATGKCVVLVLSKNNLYVLSTSFQNCPHFAAKLN